MNLQKKQVEKMLNSTQDWNHTTNAGKPLSSQADNQV